MPDNTGFEVYEVTTNLPANTTQTVSGACTADNSSATHKGSGTITSSSNSSVTIKNDYPATGNLILKKDLLTASQSEANNAHFEYTVVFHAPANVTFNATNPSTVSVSSSAFPRRYLVK